jgi:hypothetical protein
MIGRRNLTMRYEVLLETRLDRPDMYKTHVASMPQVEALAVLADGASHGTSRTTHHGWVSGQSAKGLVQRGWAEYVRNRAETSVRITDLGLQLYKSLGWARRPGAKEILAELEVQR